MPVEFIETGDMVFAPLAGTYFEIKGILSRDVPNLGLTQKEHHPLWPVVLRSGLLGDGRPKTDIAVSPMQQALVVDRTSRTAGGRISTIELSAESLLARHPHRQRKRFRMKVARYFAIFTDQPQYLDVAGVLMRTYCS